MSFDVLDFYSIFREAVTASLECESMIPFIEC